MSRRKLPALPGRAVNGCDLLGEGLAVHDLHGVEDLAVLEGAVVVDRHDSRVLELGGGLGLLEEARLQRGAGAEVDALHGDHPVQQAVSHAPDLTHAAAAQDAELLVPVEEQGAVLCVCVVPEDLGAIVAGPGPLGVEGGTRGDLARLQGNRGAAGRLHGRGELGLKGRGDRDPVSGCDLLDQVGPPHCG